MDEAARLLVEQGGMPLPLDALADRAGVSKTLPYFYFPRQADLANAILGREMEALLVAGLAAASRAPALDAAAVDCALLYFERVAKAGPALHLVLRDPFMAGRLAARPLQIRDRVFRRLARLARRELGLCAKEAVAALGIAATIPEEAGQLAFRGELTEADARDLCRRLVGAAVDAFRPRG